MKKRSLLTLLLCEFSAAYSLSVGNPCEASLFFDEVLYNNSCCDPCDQVFYFNTCSIRFGFYGDYVFNRRLETVTGRDIDFSEMATNAGYLALNFWETFDIFTTLGATKITFNTSLGPFNSGNASPRFNFESSTALSWSIGGEERSGNAIDGL